jgi:dipeptidyl-peptidase-4
LATKGIIYTKIDGRGTGFQSDEHMFEIYKKLGQVEVEDQKTVVQKLGEMHDFIDKEKVGIWGWSYGGFVTTMALEKDIKPDSLFKCGIAGIEAHHEYCQFFLFIQWLQ